MERRRLEARSQACIAKWHRGWMGRQRFADEKKRRLKSMCAEAKKVEELWDDQGAAFYYYDHTKNQSFHEPPKTGYKRRDELLVLATGEAVEDPDHVLNDQQQAANAAADAAKLLFGLYSEKASKPMEELQGFLQERLALGGAASDVRMVQDERFNETCSTLETLSNELYYAGRLGRPGAKPPVRVEQEALQQELEKRVQEALLQQQSSIYSSTGLAEGSTTTGTLHRKSQISMMGWQELYDDQGNKYWYDEATGASQYENPYEGMERPSQMTQQSPPSKFERPQTSYSERAAGLSRPETRGTEASHNSIIPSEEWQQAQDGDGNFYWYNTRTNQSQYEDPYDGSRPDTAGYQLGSPTGATYDTNQGTYDNTYDGSNYDQSAPVYALEGAAQSPWSKHQDEQGYDYWYNAETHDSTYDDPHALQG